MIDTDETGPRRTLLLRFNRRKRTYKRGDKKKKKKKCRGYYPFHSVIMCIVLFLTAYDDETYVLFDIVVDPLLTDTMAAICSGPFFCSNPRPPSLRFYDPSPPIVSPFRKSRRFVGDACMFWGFQSNGYRLTERTKKKKQLMNNTTAFADGPTA